MQSNKQDIRKELEEIGRDIQIEDIPELYNIWQSHNSSLSIFSNHLGNSNTDA